MPRLGNLSPYPIYKTRRANSCVRSGGCLPIAQVPVAVADARRCWNSESNAVEETEEPEPKLRRTMARSNLTEGLYSSKLTSSVWGHWFRRAVSAVTRQGITRMFDKKRFWRRIRHLFLSRLQCSIIQVIFRDSCISTSFVGLWRWSRWPPTLPSWIVSYFL